MKKVLRIFALFTALCMAFAMTAFAGFQTAETQDEAEEQIAQEAPAGESAEGESQEGEAPAGESAEGESQEGESAEGESGGESAGGSDDSVMAMNAGASSGDVVYSINEEGLTVNEEAAGYEITGEVTAEGADGIEMVIDEFTTNGFEVTGGEFTISNSTITKNVTGEIDVNAAGGVCARVTGGILTLVNCDFVNNGKGGRNGNYTVECNQQGVLVAINSSIVQTGFTGDPEGYTSEIADPPSNLGLLISGYARANMSLGKSQTYYYGSYVETEGWAAMSTDSAQSGFAFYSYDSTGKALHGGYGTYADTSCVDWFYATVLSSPEVGAIISNNGEIHMANGEDATAEALAYLPEGYEVSEQYTAMGGRCLVEAGRNDFQLHSPDMMGSGAGSDYHAVLDLKDTDIITTEELDAEATLIDWSSDYGPAVGEYIDLVKGANILVKSTGAYITLDNVTAESSTGVLLMTALNSDSMSRYAKATDDMTGKGAEMTIVDSEIAGDVLHYDYQRNVIVTLENSTWSGAFETIDKEAWDAIWSDECKADEKCYWILDTDVYFDGTGTVSAVSVGEGSVWNVTGESNIDMLTVAEGGTVNGVVTVDGEVVDVTAGGTFEGAIVVAPAEAAEEAPAEGESPEGESPEGESPEGEAPAEAAEAAPAEGESPEGESPEGESPEGESPAEEAPAVEAAEADAAAPAADGDPVQAAFVEYIHEWLINEDENNDTMTSDIVENEFMPLVEQMDFVTFPAEMIYSGMLETGVPMTYEEFAAQYVPAEEEAPAADAAAPAEPAEGPEVLAELPEGDMVEVNTTSDMAGDITVYVYYEMVDGQPVITDLIDKEGGFSIYAMVPDIQEFQTLLEEALAQ